MSMRSGFRTSSKKKLLSEMNVIPYVDVTLILLIIFMISAPVAQQAVTVELPQTPAIEQQAQITEDIIKPFVITVTREGYYKTSLNPDIILTASEIAVEVVARAQLNAEQTFYIQGDRLTYYENVMHLFIVLKNNGVENVSLLTKPTFE